MNWILFEQQWTVYVGPARVYWSELTDEDWQTITGKKEQLVGCVQKRYGISQEAAEKQVDKWSQSLPELPDLLLTTR